MCVKLIKPNQHRRKSSLRGTGLPTLKSIETVELGDTGYILFLTYFILTLKISLVS